ncbi:MAG: PKD domain-containing protein, partial [Verrucomicrobiota bacterium]
GDHCAGLGYVGAPGAWIRASFEATGGVPSHELGHNFGLNHANSWDTGGQSILGAGSNVEYGDSFDTMGNATAGKRHFNARYKNFLDWLPTTQVKIVTASGNYRLFAHDVTNAATTRAVRIARNTQTNYWLEFRQRFTDRPALMDGVGLRWARSGNQQSLLLDVTPGSPDGKNDSALVIGRTFSDRAAGIHITPVAKGGTVPESLDLQVNLGKFTNNQLPTVTLTASAASAFAGTPITFTATASDPDGDALAYSWDFGDNAIVAANTNRVSRSWGTAREYWVRCTVSDMKGGEGSAAVLVRIGNPTTYHISGRVLQGGKPVAGVRVEVSNTQQTYTTSDGSYTLTGITRGTYTVKAIGEGYIFTPSGFSNPLSVTANVENAHLEASQPGDLAQVSLVPLGAQWNYYDTGDLAGTLWRSPGFNDGTWTKGAAPLGYGDDNIVTTVKFGPSATAKYITTWFRHSFWVDDPSRFLSATVGLIRDDGAAVYLNGTEIFRSNLPTGTLTAATRASASVGGTDETTVYEASVDPKGFRVGINVLAVEVHQYAPDSSDLRFALQLNGLLRPSAASPRLEFVAGSDQVRLSWPVTTVGFELQETKSLETPWFLSDETVRAEAGQNIVVPPLTENLRFFRLANP